MKPIPEQYITAMPSAVAPTRASCEAAANATLLVLFMMGSQSEAGQSWPPIISNGRELWPMPPPWSSDEEDQIALIDDLNGRQLTGQTGFLEHCKRNATEFNGALEVTNPELARQIASQACPDSAHVWDYLNALALASESEEEYRPLVLDTETKQAYYIAAGIVR